MEGAGLTTNGTPEFQISFFFDFIQVYSNSLDILLLPNFSHFIPFIEFFANAGCGEKNEKIITIKCKTLEKILDNIKIPKLIDLFSLDVEGYEFEVLNGINFNSVKFKYILVDYPVHPFLMLLTQ